MYHNDNPFIKNTNNDNKGYDPYNNSSNKNFSSSWDENPSFKQYSNKAYYYHPRIIAWHGRIGRLRFLAYNIFLYLAVAMVSSNVLISEGIGSLTLLQANLFLGFIIFVTMVNVAFSKRRLNDLNQNGWFVLLYLIPIVNLLLFLYLLFIPGSESPNNYGPAPMPANNPLMVGFAILGLVALVLVLSKNTNVRNLEANFSDSGYYQTN